MSYSISAALTHAAKKIITVTDVPQLEAEILLSHVLNVTRVYLHTWPEKLIDTTQQIQFDNLISKRAAGEPIAYLTGHREFWSLNLIVTPDVLIPRSDTELLVEKVLETIKSDSAVIADLGTGSGAIALALAKEKPNWIIYAIDKSKAALDIAQLNAKELGLSNIRFSHGHWFDALPTIKYDAIVSNPPYIAEDDAHLLQGDLRFEPRMALVSAKMGLQDLAEIILEAKYSLKSGGILFVEHGFQQAKNVLSFFKKEGYTSTHVYQDLGKLDRVTMGTWLDFDIGNRPKTVTNGRV